MCRLGPPGGAEEPREWELIRDLSAAGSSMSAIAQAMGRAPSTSSRELGRNSDPRFGYLPHGAQRQAAARRARPKTAKLVADPALRESLLPRCGIDAMLRNP